MEQISEFPGYLIDISGNVFSKRSNKILKQTETNGYNCVTLYHDKQRFTKKVHRLLALTFIPNPENLPCVDHISRVRNDNRLCNLRWSTVRGNLHNMCTQSKLGVNVYSLLNRRCKFHCRIQIEGVSKSKSFLTYRETVEYRNNILQTLN